MAVATKSENKSGFVKDFLSKHPEGNVKAVNEAWTAAGMLGAIGATLIYQTRADMGLSQAGREVETQDSRQGEVNHQAVLGSEQPRQDHVREGIPDRPSAGQRRCR